MRLLYYCDWFEQYTADLVLAVARQQRSSHADKVSLVVRQASPEFGGQARLSDGLQIREQLKAASNLFMLPGTYRSLRSLWVLRAAVRKARPDVVHLQQTGDPRFLWMAFRRKTALTMHEPTPRAGHERQRTFRQFSSSAVQRLYRRLSDLIIVHTESSFQGLSPREKLKAVVVPHGVPICLLPPNHNSKTILFFGRADGYKGLETLVDAMALVWRVEPRARLRILASGSPRRLDVTDDRVSATWAGFSDNTLHDALLDARAVCLPYTTASGSGAASLAHGTGRPLVATDIDGLRQLVTQPQLLVRPDDTEDLARALIDVLSHNYEVQKICEDRTWAAVAKTHLSLYRRLCHDRKFIA